MVPEGWTLTDLGGAVTRFVGGGTPDRRTPKFWSGDIPWASVKDLGPLRIERTEESITEQGLRSSSAALLPAGTIVLATRMAVGRAGIAAIDLAINQDLKGLILSEEVSTQFVHYWLQHSELEMAALATGTTVKGLRVSALRRLPLLLPPLPEQKKIAAILSCVGDAIAATRKIIEQTEQVKKGLLQTLMTRGIGHTRFKKTEIGEIPVGWEVMELETIASVGRGKFTARPRNDPKYYGGHFPFVQTGDVASADLLIERHSQTLNEEGLRVSRLFPAGTILMTIAANIGEVAEASYPVAFPDSVVGISPRTGVDGRWLLHALGTRKEYLNGVATRNTQKNINLQVLRPLLVALPAAEEQSAIARILDSCIAGQKASRASLTHLQTLKRGLLQDLLTGRVRVTPD